MSLIVQAICALPVEDLEILFPWEKEVINREIQHRVIRLRHFGKRLPGAYCECNMNGDCLCYLMIIKNHYIDTAWHTENDYVNLGNWIRRN